MSFDYNQYFSVESGSFIIESGSVPVFQVSASTVMVSGSLIPADPENTASAELGSEAYPWKELYVESASINFIDTKQAIGSNARKVRFSRDDVEKLKRGESINDSGILSASGDMHVVGNSTFKGRTAFEGLTQMKGETHITGALSVIGAADFKGHFRINGTRLTEAELTTLQGITATTAELNKIDGFTGVVADLNYAKDLRATGVTSTEFNKLDGYTGDHNDLNYAKDLRATGVTATEFNKLDGFTGDVNDLNYLKTLRATGVTNTEFDYLDGVTSNIQTQIDNAGGGGTVDSSITNGSTNAVQNNAVHDALALKATTAGVVGDLLPDADGTRDLGSTSKEWQDLHIDGTANIDTLRADTAFISAGEATLTILASKGPHILGGAASGASGAQTITSMTSTYIVDCRRASVFILNVINGNVHGFRGLGVVGEVITFIALARVTVHHAETGVTSTSQYQDPRSRDIIMLANTSMRMIYTGAYWVRML